MAMVTDPVCGMRIDPDDAAATAEHDGQRYWFCSEACRNAFVADPVPTQDRLTEAELARRSGASAERIRELANFGIVEPNANRTFARRDVMRARVVDYLQTVGISPADLGRALGSGHLTLGYLEDAGRQYPRLRSTYAEVGAEMGLPFETLGRLYVAFGLRPPTHDEQVREEDLPTLEIMRVFSEGGVVESDLLRMARVWGDATRRVAEYLPHYFHIAVEEGFRQRGLGDNQAYEAAVNEVGMRFGRAGEDLLGWLFRRHSEAFMTAHQLDHVETALAEAGVRPRPPRTPEAAVFADLSGFTRLTEQSGDAAAADVALAFAQLVNEVATRHRGTTIKLLGDGVLLHFADPTQAVLASLELIDQAVAQGLPPAHVGVEAGPMLYDQGDYFGRTVNLAARIAAEAPAGCVYVGASLREANTEDAFELRKLGEFELKGIAEPVTLYEAVTRAIRPRPA